MPLPILATMIMGAVLVSVPPAAADEGEAAFKTRCGDCHGPREFPRWAKARPDIDKRRAFLDGFLKRHYPPPDNDRALIIAYVERVIAAGR